MKVQIFIVALCVAYAYGRAFPQDSAVSPTPTGQPSETPKLPEVVTSSQAPVADVTGTQAPESPVEPAQPVEPAVDSNDKPQETSPKSDNPEKEEKVEKKDEDAVADQQSTTQLPQNEEAPVGTSTAAAADQGQSDAANNEVTPGVPAKESKSVDEEPTSTGAPSEAPASSPAADQPAADPEVKPTAQPEANDQDKKTEQPSGQGENASDASQADAVSSTALPETTKANE